MATAALRLAASKETRPSTSAGGVLLTLLVGICFLGISRFRLIDGDEGFYLLAAKSVFQGKLLYRDFFFTQMPLQPYVYGLWLSIAGMSWEAARLLSVICATILGGLIYWHVARRTKSHAAGCGALLLYGASSQTLMWFSVVKTYSLSTLLLFAAYLLVWEFSGQGMAFLGGILLALSTDTRLFFIATLPVFLALIYWRKENSSRLVATYMAFGSGVTLGLLPNLLWLFAAPRHYFFNNLGFHALRSEAGLVGGFTQKAAILLKLSGLRPNPEISGLPFGILLLLNGLLFLRCKAVRGRPVPPALSLAAVVIFVSVLPTPTFIQYFSVAVPFLLVGAVVFASEYCSSRRRVAAMAVLLIAYVFPLPAEIVRYCSSGVGVIGVESREKAESYRIDSIRSISREVDRRTAPGETVLSDWSGNLFESHSMPLPGTENEFGRYIAHRVPAEVLARYGVRSLPVIEDGLRRQTPCVVVWDSTPSTVTAALQAGGYREIYRVGQWAVYTCRP